MLTAPLRPLRRGAPGPAAHLAGTHGRPRLPGSPPFSGGISRGAGGRTCALSCGAVLGRPPPALAPPGTGRPRSGTAAPWGEQAQVCRPVLPYPVAKSRKEKVQLLCFQSGAGTARVCFIPYPRPRRASLRHPRSVSLERPSALLIRLFLGCVEPGGQPREGKAPGKTVLQPSSAYRSPLRGL